MASKKIELTDADWIEIYYAVSDKADGIKQGHFGPEDRPGQNKEWIEHLRAIAARIARKVDV